MNTFAASSASTSPFTPARFNPPANVRRWTGRTTPTILLPSLASLRLDAATRYPRASVLDRSRN